MDNGTKDLTFIRDWVRKTKSASAAPVQRPPLPPPSRQPAPIAITGVGGFFPGCEDVAAFWRKLDRDESLITETPSDRSSALHGWRGGFLPDVASFDPGAFDILPVEAEEMDPRQRLLLMSTWRTLEDAGLDPRSLRKSNTGVFVAGEGNEYAVLMSRAGYTPKMGFGQANSMLANRISYQFDFAGPSEMVDATCAGFAVALHRAVVALRAGLIDRAIVGAANVILLPDPFVFLAEAGQLSTRPTVKSFGREGDGFLRAEGVGTILIERAQDARLGGRRSYAEIKHTAVNFNGQGGVSMASPNTEAHVELIKACYRGAGIDPRDLSYVEAQGMGSPVADIAEWTALNRALQELCAERGVSVEPGSCLVSTLKPMLGHMHSASSLGALLKVLRSFQTGKIHRVLDFTEPNEFCDMEGTPCRIATETEDWKSSGKRRLAAIHAYGSGGNNAHVLLEEAESPRERAPERPGREFAPQPYWFPSESPRPETDGKAAEVLPFIRKILATDGKAFDRETPFTELGLDSLSVAAFVAKLEAGFGISLRKSDVFSHPTPARLASYIGSLIESRPVPVIHRPRARESPDEIAIVGISLEVAGAGNHEDYWRLLREGRSAISTVPPERWEGDGAPARNFQGGFLAEVDTFDPLFFRISPKESVNMDPRHRKLLHAAWAAIEDAGHNPEDWRGAGHGIFIGIEESDYPYDMESSITAVHAGTAPARIGYFLDTKGPVVAISTACSSSLVALHYACRSILEGESDCALAGGCNILSQPARSFQALSQMGGMLSPDGTCYAFDRRANGMVLGEGVGMVVLKRLAQARRDGDPIYAVIKGSGINYDGRTNGLTAPSGERQRELYERVYRQSGIEPSEITYVVAHGTGTSLGDPVEGNALIDAFGASATEPWCALTSPKTNIGHTQAASGIVNLITAALALKNGEIPPSLNFTEANADLPLGASPFYVNTSLRPWDAPERHAAVSSFGHTGTNAHVVLGAEAGKIEAAEEGPVTIVLSAQSGEGLERAARNLLAAPVTDLAALAYTLQVGRAAMDERLGLVVRSMDELRDKLGGFAAGRTVAGLHRGQARRDDSMQALFADDAEIRKSIHGWMATAQPAEVLKLWVNGLAVDWRQFYREKKPRRLHLPTYPFEKERYWLKAKPPLQPVAEEPMPVATFREEWVVDGPPTVATSPKRVLVCLLGEPDQEFAWEEELPRVAPETRWIFVSERSGFEKAFREHPSIDALVCLPPRQAIGDPSVVVPLFHALGKARLVPGRVFLACPFRTALERCFMDAWVGFERSLKPVFPQTKVVVVGWQGDETGGAEALWAELRGGEPQSVRHENGERRVLRVEPADLVPAAPSFERGGTYLVVGGCGGLGFPLAEHLAQTYSANLILVGRSLLDDRRQVRLEALKRFGGTVVYAPADVCDRAGLTRALAEAREQVGPIHGVVHAAGLAGSESILEKDAEAFRRVLNPKIAGTMILDEVLRDEPLDFVAYFSSSAASLGDFGACDYAIANRFQTAYAGYRNALRKRGERTGQTTAINWPVWEEGGVDEPTRFYLQTSGQRALRTDEGLALFETLLGQPAMQHLVLAGDPARIRRFWPAAPQAAEPPAMGIEDSIRLDLKALISDLLKIDRQKMRLEANLADFGFDSISLADFAARLSLHYDVPFTPALFFGHSTIERLTRYLLAEHRPLLERFYERKAGPFESAPPKPGGKTGPNEPIAIIGRSGRFPQARDVDAMWRILAEGRDAVERVPAERFDHPGWMGCLPGVAEFDPLFFEISPREAEAMDPRQRHLLQESWNALEDAGIGPRQLASQRMGVFVGAEEGDYALLAPTSDLGANHGAILASRLAYFLDFRGPVLAINTACSSALVALHQACSSLRNEECDAALVAGVSLQSTAAGHIAMAQAGMLSPDGKCSVFDREANGMVPGEAAVALVLKRLSRAEADGDPIRGVVRASGVNYDGRTNGITAPNGVAQTELLKSVHAAAQLDPAAIEYVVAHGTGTKLGDPVEVNALRDAFKIAATPRAWCALTSTKSNFGHTFAASGLVSVVSLLEAFRHEKIPASLHCAAENDYIVREGSPFYVNKAAKAWPKRAGKKRTGAVSAFGMSGTNAHVVLEEYDAPGQEIAPPKPGYLLVLSAKTEEALRGRIDALAQALRAGEVRAAGLAGVSFTLLEGRHHFSHRAALVVRDFEDALRSLERWRAGEMGEDVRQGRAPEEPVARDGALPDSLPALAELYCQGGVIPWPALFGDHPPRRIGLPAYPFARETYWAEKKAALGRGLHPLAHANTSDLGEQRFTSTFGGDEFFFAHHRVRNERIFPAVGYLEMARAAAAFSLPESGPEGAFQLTDVVWLRPLVDGDSPSEVRIVLREDGDRLAFEVSVGPEVHAQGKVRLAGVEAPAALDLAALRGRMDRGRLDPASCYAGFHAAGVDYGPAFQGLREVLLGEGEVLARIALPESVRDLSGDYVLHPSLMDSALQATIGLSSERDSAARIPFALESLRGWGALPEEVWVWARRSVGRITRAGAAMFDLDLADDTGRVLVELRGLSTLDQSVTVVRKTLSGEEFFLRDHGSLLPAVVSFEWAREAGRKALGRDVSGLKNVVWNQPLRFDGMPREVQTTLESTGAFQVRAGGSLLVQGSILDDEGPKPETLAISEIRSRCVRTLPSREFEPLIEAKLGPSMRSLTAFHYRDQEAFALLKRPTSEDAKLGLPPSLLNGALQACTMLARLEDPEAPPPLPFSLEELRIHGPIPMEVCVHVRRIAAKFDLVLATMGGAVAVSIRGYTGISAKAGADTLFAVPGWKEAAFAPASRAVANPIFLLAGESAGVREKLEQSWPGARIEALSGAAVESDFLRVFELVRQSLRNEPAWPIVLLAGSRSPFSDACAALFRTARIEQPRFRAKVLATVDLVEKELGQPPEDMEVRVDEAGEREVRSLRETSLGPIPESATGQVIWITGGLGGLGRAFARHYALVEKAIVFVTGRFPLDESKRAFLQQLQAAGGEIRYLPGDVARPEEVEGMLGTIQETGARLTGIIHAAGVIEDAYLRDKSQEAVARVWRPKVAGALALDEATRHLELDFLAFFSSLAGTFGNAGQADYAGANAFLDGFAHERNRLVAAGQRRGRTLSIAWPLWREGGMGMDPQSEILLHERSGLIPMETASGIAAFRRALASGHSQVLVLHGDAAKIRAKILPAEKKAETSANLPAAGLSPEQVQDELRRLVSEQQKIAPEKLELDVELPRYGFDSIRLTELANRLNKRFSLELMPTLFFEHTTLRSIAGHLIERHPGALAARLAEPVKSSRGPAETPPAAPPIAIVGMSGRFPGSENLEEFWRHLEANHDLISEVPADRWDWREIYGDPVENPGKTNVKSAGFMAGIDRFDPAFFGISPREAISLDPQLRLLLETVWATIEDAGYRAGDLSGTKTGVFVGVSTSDYKEAWLRKAAAEEGMDGPALVSHFVIANRISYALNLQGPSEPIDTACSSSLIAIHRAIEAMRQGNCEQAIVGGVNVICTPDITIAASRAGMLSEDGRCKTFDQRADGYGRGEGVAAILLKPLDAALRDGDQVYALVRGSAENHGGRAQSPTAPNPAAQRDLLVSAYGRANVDPRSVGYIEVHGTGTALGDPIEIDGLRGAFEALYEKAGASIEQAHCGLGSVKTNVGHLEAAAGLAGVLKVVMMLRRRKIPGNAHLRQPNPYLRLDGTPFYLARETRDWIAPADQPRRAGVSSFGIGGSNAHVILEEFTAEPAAAELPGPQAIVLSARNEERLEVLARDLRAFVDRRAVSLAEIAYVLQVGREAMEERLGFVAASREELSARLTDFIDGRLEGRPRGRVSREGGRARESLHGAEPARLVERWVQGAELDWREWWTGSGIRRVSLPTYPFARSRFWFESKQEAAAVTVEPFVAQPVPPAPSSGGKRESIETFLAESLAKILYLEEGAIERESSFIDIGLDSVLAVEWIQSIKQKYGIKLPATKVYDYPTVSALADFLAGSLAPETPAPALTLEEILAQVGQNRLTVEEAEQLIDRLENAEP